MAPNRRGFRHARREGALRAIFPERKPWGQALSAAPMGFNGDLCPEGSMRVMVTGGRHYSYRWAVRNAMGSLPRAGLVVVHGACATGLDALVKRWCEERKVDQDPFPADWDTLGLAAGPVRNQAMVDSRPELLLAFPGGRGTADAVRRARAAGIEIRFVVGANGVVRDVPRETSER